MFKKLIPILIITILGILDFALIGFAWQNPTQAPPGGNLTLPWMKSGTNVYLTNTSDKVGIGTTEPSAPLHVFANVDNGLWFQTATDIRDPYIRMSRLTPATGGDFAIALRGNGTGWLSIHDANGYVDRGIMIKGNKVGINKGTFNEPQKELDVVGDAIISGNVGIGTTTPVNKLDVSGNIGVSGNVTAAAFYYGSDQSLKTNIKPFDKSLQKILNLEPVYFDYKENNQHSLGFIAQDVEKQFPELVTTDSLTGLKSLDYSRLTAPLVMAIKEQQIQIESQQQQINELKTQLNNL